MITAAQLRAARGLLDWTRSELAKASGLSAETIKNIEHGIYTPQESTIAAIVNTFSEHDVEFAEDEGVRVRKNRVRVYTGRAGYKEFLDHIFNTLKDSGGRIRQFNLGDDKHLPFAGDFAEEHIKRMERIRNLDAKVLLPPGDKGFAASYCQYRGLHKEHEMLIPYYIYSDYLIIPIRKDDQKIEIVSVHSEDLAARYVEQFESLWDNAVIPETRGRK